MSDSKFHIPSLDGLRAVAIAIVFIGHAGLGHIVPGGFGVTVFFFISGYLITTLLCREFDRYDGISMRAFYVRRLLRLMPPLLCALGFGIALTLVGLIHKPIDIPTLISQIFFFTNYYQIYGSASPIPGQGVLWSLAVEEHFYLIWPAIFLIFARGRIGLAAVAAMILWFLLWRGFRFYVLGSSEDVIYYLSDTRLDSLLFGCALALMMWRGVVPAAGHDNPRLRILLLGLSFATILLTFALRDPAFRSVVRYSLQGLALMPIFYYAVTRPQLWLFRPLNWGFVRKVGVWSYSIYLVHDVILKILEQKFAGMAHGLLIAGIVGAVLTMLYADIIHRLVERPFARLRRNMTGHPQAEAPKAGTRLTSEP